MSEEKKVDATEVANPQETEKTENPTGDNAETAVDYKTKFSESSKEALRLLEETKAKDAEIERLKKLAESGTVSNGDNSESLYPGFDLLTDEEQKNLLAYTDGIKKKALDEVYKDPAIAFARQSFNEKKWNDAFEKVVVDFPELRESKEDFKSKYFNVNNVPDNITDILKDLSKVHLFDKARDIGAKEAIEQAGRLEIERAKGGDKTPTSSGRSLEDWSRLAAENPAKFAQESKQFNDDLASGKLK